MINLSNLNNSLFEPVNSRISVNELIREHARQMDGKILVCALLIFSYFIYVDYLKYIIDEFLFKNHQYEKENLLEIAEKILKAVAFFSLMFIFYFYYIQNPDAKNGFLILIGLMSSLIVIMSYIKLRIKWRD
jgi:hypothetical protein